MDRRIVRQLVNFAATRRAEQAVNGREGGPEEPQPGEIPRAALAALALLPFRRLFRGASISSKIEEFVYTFY